MPDNCIALLYSGLIQNKEDGGETRRVECYAGVSYGLSDVPGLSFGRGPVLSRVRECQKKIIKI